MSLEPTINDDITAALPELRRQAESMMTLTLAAYSPTGLTKDADGYDIPTFTFEGQTFGKVQAGAQAGGDTPTRYIKIGGTDRPVLASGLHIPITAKIPNPGEERGQVGGAWEYVVLAVGSDADLALLGRRYMVVSVPVKSYATARRLDVIELEV
ncbi:hypothetical protein GUY44_18905 [Pimelobacter simplex]|uniref:Uncharacterized protein n=1 Tax=Nocardioides simplex TaxID=2045 RepID=A0A0A1DL11_NOCSI|nr:DUF6093 family protein [Pimelobacter simplex]AIY17999.1 hypothetical protein KR76_16755 [Pimelobacter simplex]MCG8152563.1 hypothetical protein [Pimelobacter simplex]GEB17061.1 hypothetical protein NSI01_53760 [Pimelobacter simplex]SFM76954.1 hypothetical protein SAMN05421671_3436 [Pimelobacter simplex]